MSAPHRTRSEREQLELFRAPSLLATRRPDGYPFFSLAKTLRVTQIDYRMSRIAIRVGAVPERGMATASTSVPIGLYAVRLSASCTRPSS
jgi:plasmid replication initiation protein